MDQQDRTGVEAALAGGFFFFTPPRQRPPPGPPPGVVGGNNQSCLSRQTALVDDPHQLAQNAIGQRQIIDVGSRGTLVRWSAIVNAGWMRHGQMDEYEANILVTNQCLSLREDSRKIGCVLFLLRKAGLTSIEPRHFGEWRHGIV